jgi:tRNA G37 N-methylase TrmD
MHAGKSQRPKFSEEPSGGTAYLKNARCLFRDCVFYCGRYAAIARLISRRSGTFGSVVLILGEVSIISVKDRLFGYVVRKSHSAISTDNDSIAVEEVYPREWVKALLEQES